MFKFRLNKLIQSLKSILKKKNHKQDAVNSNNKKSFINGFVSSNELVDVIKMEFDGFSKYHLWFLVALKLVPEPVFNLPVNTKLNGAYLQAIISRVREVLNLRHMSMKDIPNHLSTCFDGTSDGTASTRSGKLSLWDMQVIADRFGFSKTSAKDKKVAKVLANMVVHGINSDSQLFSCYVKHAYFPKDMAGKIAKQLAIKDPAFEWGDDLSEITIIKSIVSTLDLNRKDDMTLNNLFEIVSEALLQIKHLRENYDNWKKQVDSSSIIAAYSIGNTRNLHIDDLMKLDLPHSLPRKVGYIVSSFSNTLLWLLLSVYLVYVSGLFPIEWIVRFSSSIGLLFWIVGPLWTLGQTFNDVCSKPIQALRLFDLLDKAGAIIVQYGWIYWLFSRANAFSPGHDYSLFDTIYLSIVTFLTTGLVDTTPSTVLAQIIVVSEMIIGIGFTLLVLGIFISRLSNKVTTDLKNEEE